MGFYGEWVGVLSVVSFLLRLCGLLLLVDWFMLGLMFVGILFWIYIYIFLCVCVCVFFVIMNWKYVYCIGFFYF